MDPKDARQNNFGSLRIALAALVILGHSFELIDGHRAREPLTRVFGTLSLGELAVDGFFLVSGYLVLRSYLGTPRLSDYLAKRILRIYPGFLVAFLVSVYLVAPFGGGEPWRIPLGRLLRDMLFLDQPLVPNVFATLPYPFANGAMWTIAHEFRCYLMVVALGTLGLLGRRGLYLLVLAGLAALYAHPQPLHAVPGLRAEDAKNVARLALMFACGGAFHLFRDRIRYTGRGALLAAALLLPLLFSRPLAEPAVAGLGGYLLLWFALAVPPLRLSLLANRTDPSYGLYLYGWPIQSLLILHRPDLSPWSVAGLTLAAAGLAGLASWRVVERPALARAPALARLIATLLPRRRTDSAVRSLPPGRSGEGDPSEAERKRFRSSRHG